MGYKKSKNSDLFDTFEGMTEPDATIDVDLYGNAAANDWDQIKRRGVRWSYAPIDEVRETMEGSGYPMEQVEFIKGPGRNYNTRGAPREIALLRLDTDWYASTKH